MTNSFIETYDGWAQFGDRDSAFRKALKEYIDSRCEWTLGHKPAKIDSHLATEIDTWYDRQKVKVGWGYNKTTTVNHLKLAIFLYEHGVHRLATINPDNLQRLNNGKLKELLTHVKSKTCADLTDKEHPHAARLCYFYTDIPPDEMMTRGAKAPGINPSLSLTADSAFLVASPSRNRLAEARDKPCYCYTVVPRQKVAIDGKVFIPGAIEPYEIAGYRDNRDTTYHAYHENTEFDAPRPAIPHDKYHYRADTRSPGELFNEGFVCRNASNGTALGHYIASNSASAFISFAASLETASRFPEALAASDERWVYKVADSHRFISHDETRAQGEALAGGDEEAVAIGRIDKEHIVEAYRVRTVSGELQILETRANPHYLDGEGHSVTRDTVRSDSAPSTRSI